jgi:glycosyltransferase involved in cell wall biosynthesis
MNPVKLSAVIITFNEAAKIERCIKSLIEVCDEVVILDSFSTDNTRELATALGAKVFTHAFDGYIQQKNRAITYASFPYVLSLDADEALSDELKASILIVKQNWTSDGYSMNRLNNYGGQWIRHGAWYPDRKLRLWDSRKGAWGGENPHDKYIQNEGCTATHLKGNLLHYTMNGYDDLQKQTDKFAAIAAKAMFERGKSISKPAIWFKVIFRFIKEYILLAGFMDGKAGWQIARMNARYVRLKYFGLLNLKS